jgi:hypothetical protein
VHLGCRPTRTEEDDLMTDFAGDVPAEFARLCKAYDVHDRLITCGNAEPRRSQYQQRVLDQWPPRPDTYAEMAKALEWHNPDPLNCISVHCYDLEKRFPGTETYTGLLRAYRTAADRLGKPLFLGEFHGLKKENALETIRAIVENRIQLSAVWAIGRVEYSLDNDPATRDEVLEAIQKANRQLARDAEK